MRDEWYADNRDLVKWGVLLQLAGRFESGHILYLAFYRPSKFGPLVIDSQEYDLAEEVIAHFRDLQAIGGINSKVRLTVFDLPFHDRTAYLKAALTLVASVGQERSIIFLDPDTGLQPSDNNRKPQKPRKPKLVHVLKPEVHAIWKAMKAGDVLAFYQHQTNRAGREWIKPKRNELANALAVPTAEIKIAKGSPVRLPKPTVNLPQDVVIFYTRKPAAKGKSSSDT
jgi:hypothetical protein